MPTKLGQNFLINHNIARKIVEAANLTPSDIILEIGPGKGILTEELAKKAGKVVAIEIDKKLVVILRDKFKQDNNIEIIEGDILKINLNKLIPNFQSPITNKNPNSKFLITNYKIVANLPYYITSPVIRMFLESEKPPSEMILMVQKEVAERIVASPGQMSILSVAVQYYAKPEILFTVGKKNFDPAPKVDSAVIKISEIKKQKSKIEDKKFFRLIRAGFCSKRKTLVNNLANSFHLDKKKVEEKIKKAGFLTTARAQELSVKDWKRLIKKLG